MSRMVPEVAGKALGRKGLGYGQLVTDWMRIAEGLMAARLIYFSGITLSLYGPRGLDCFREILAAARARGASIAFDGNFRPRGWGGRRWPSAGPVSVRSAQT